jgi:hypothetical protein
MMKPGSRDSFSNVRGWERSTSGSGVSPGEEFLHVEARTARGIQHPSALDITDELQRARRGGE